MIHRTRRGENEIDRERRELIEQWKSRFGDEEKKNWKSGYGNERSNLGENHPTLDELL